MSQGHIGLAFSYHLLGPAVYFAAVISIPLMLYQIITARRIEWFHRLCYSHRLARILAILLGGYHLVRIALLIESGNLLFMIAHAPVIGLLKHL